jgi:hypothetical protein
MAIIVKPILRRVFSCIFILLQLKVNQSICTGSNDVVGLICQWVKVSKHPHCEILRTSKLNYLLNFKSVVVQNQYIKVLSINDVSVV